MSHDGLPARARTGAREAVADRPSPRGVPRPHRLRTARWLGLGAALTLALAACGGATSSGGVAGATGTPPGSGAAPSTEASPSAPAATKTTVTFQEANASKIFGGGILTDLGDGSVAVTIGVVAIGFDDPMPAELATGSCADAIAAPVPSGAPPSVEPSAGASAAPSAAASTAPSAAASVEPSAPTESVAPTPATLPAPLTDVSAGSSNTVVQITLADLLASPSAIVIHHSASDLTVVACADITLTVGPSEAPSAPAESEAPSMEVPSASASTTP